LWTDLAGEDAGQAGRAVWALVLGAREAMPFLTEQLRPVPAALPEVKQLIADLDSARFAERAKATRQLEELGELAEPSLRGALRGEVAVEGRRRIEGLLAKLGGSNQRRASRAVEALEHIGMTEARQLLRVLADGHPDAVLTREARASLERLSRRVVAVP
jgi:hypothetical protein